MRTCGGCTVTNVTNIVTNAKCMRLQANFIFPYTARPLRLAPCFGSDGKGECEYPCKIGLPSSP
eukprot:1891574-Amphidinium_carterae.1